MEGPKICVCCGQIVDVNGANTEKKASLLSVLLCTKITQRISKAADSPVAVGFDPPPVSEVIASLSNPVVCLDCEGTARTSLPLFPCNGCNELFAVVCSEYSSAEEHDNVFDEVKKKWKCLSCHKEPGGSEIKWKCPICFVKESFCGCCRKPIESEKDIWRCSRCELRYHCSCIEIEQEKIRQMKLEENSKWDCNSCVRKGKECGECQKPFSKESKKLECKGCQRVYHYECGTYDMEMFQALLEKCGWICKDCLPQKCKGFAIEAGKQVAISALLSTLVLGGITLGVGALGFRAAGVGAKTWAAWYQSNFLGGHIARKSIFSVLQSVGVKGLAVPTKAVMTGGCWAATALGRFWKKNANSVSSEENDEDSDPNSKVKKE